MMTTHTSKAAQAGTTRKRCTGCGRTKAIGQFGLHPRFKTPMHICEVCLQERRDQGNELRKKRNAIKRQEREQEEARSKVINRLNDEVGAARARIPAAPALGRVFTLLEAFAATAGPDALKLARKAIDDARGGG